MPRLRERLPSVRTVSTRRRAAEEELSTSEVEHPTVQMLTGEANSAETPYIQQQEVNHSLSELLAENRLLRLKNEDLQEEIRRSQNRSLCSRCNGTLQSSTGLIAYEGSLLPYEGKSEWEEYMCHVDVVAQANGWDGKRKTQKLASSLRGPALGVLCSLSPAERTQWIALTEALTKRFGQRNLAPKWQAKFGGPTTEVRGDIVRSGRRH